MKTKSIRMYSAKKVCCNELDIPPVAIADLAEQRLTANTPRL